MGSCVSRGEGAAGRVGVGPRRSLGVAAGGRPGLPRPAARPPAPPQTQGTRCPREDRGRGWQRRERAEGGRRISSRAWSHTQAGGRKRGRFQPCSHTPPVACSGGEEGFWPLLASLEGRWRPREKQPTVLPTLPRDTGLTCSAPPLLFPYPLRCLQSPRTPSTAVG